MYQEKVVLCGASSYEEKYYFNEDFSALPEEVKRELKILCVLFVSEVGGIGSGLKIKSIQKEKRELLASLELFYRVFVLNEEI